MTNTEKQLEALTFAITQLVGKQSSPATTSPAPQNITEEIRRITNETAANAASKALEVAEMAKTKAAEVSTLAIAEALKAATLAATKAAEAASAASTIAAATSKDLEYMRNDIKETKADIKEIKEKLDNRYVTKDDFSIVKTELSAHIILEDKAHIDYEARIRTLETGFTKLMAWVVAAGVIMGIAEFLLNKFL